VSSASIQTVLEVVTQPISVLLIDFAVIVTAVFFIGYGVAQLTGDSMPDLLQTVTDLPSDNRSDSH